MKNKIFSLGLLALGVLIFYPKANASPWPVDKWPKLRMGDVGTYEQLCEYDQGCEALKDRRGNFKLPHPLILKIFWLQKDNLSSVAEKYGIHPLIPMAAIATEHSLNVGIEDQIQDTFRAAGLTRNGRILGMKAVSYGYGQLYADAAMNAEQIVARIEERDPQDNEYIENRISSLEGAYEYVAALMLHYTEVYARAGIDIGDNPGILSTLYNIGDVDEKVQRTLDQGREPKVNYFGWFVLHNWEAFESVYNSENFNLEYVADMEQSLQESGNDSRWGDMFGLLVRDQVPTFVTTEEISLRDNYPECVLSRRHFVSKEGIENREDAYLESLGNTHLHPYKEQGAFDIYSMGFDCLGRTWGLLEFVESGRMGWFNFEDAGSSVIEMTNRPRQCEQTKILPRCVEEITELLDSPDDFLEYDENKHIAYIRLGHNSLLETKQINWQYGKNFFCDDSDSLRQIKEKLRAQDARTEEENAAHEKALISAWVSYYNDRAKHELTEILDNIIEDSDAGGTLGSEREKILMGSHVLTEEQKRELTPLVKRAVKRLEGEIDSQPPEYPTLLKVSDGYSEALDREDDYNLLRDHLTFPSTNHRYMDPSYYYFSRYWRHNLNGFEFLYVYLSWAYQYLY
ncbi:MAG: DUF1402 family protein, partial [Halobacteriovoraceae bacterium]|nr:DUF1402 family protein [Halobacteriovoraceae bacterium]